MASSRKTQAVHLSSSAAHLALMIVLVVVVLPVEYVFHRAWFRSIVSNYSGVERAVRLTLFGIAVGSLAYTMWWFYARVAFVIGYAAESWLEERTDIQTGCRRIGGPGRTQAAPQSDPRSGSTVSSGWVRSGVLFGLATAGIGSFVYHWCAGHLPTSAFGWFGYGGGLISLFACWFCGLYSLVTSVEQTTDALEIRRFGRASRRVDPENIRYVVLGNLSLSWMIGSIRLNDEKADLGIKLERGGWFPLFDVRVTTAGPLLEALQDHNVELRIADADRRRLDGDEKLLEYLRLTTESQAKE